MVAAIVVTATHGPAHRALHGVARVLVGRRPSGAVIEHHRDVRAERALYIHRTLRGEVHLAAIDRRTETHPLLTDLAHLGEAEDLETARIGEDGPPPVHEAVQTAELGDQGRARTQHQVEGVAEDDLGAQPLEFLRGHRLDRAIGADGHEGGCLDAAVDGMHTATACCAIRGEQFVPQVHGPASCMARSRNMASP